MHNRKCSVIVGNPAPASRTRTVAERVARVVADDVRPPLTHATIELADVATDLFDRESTTVRNLVEQVLDSELVVVASPTYKASYTGLLKSFLGWSGRDSLNSSLVIPLVVAAGKAHALAVEMQLRPVLVELGARMPTRGLFVEDDDATTTRELPHWLTNELPPIQRRLEGSTR